MGYSNGYDSGYADAVADMKRSGGGGGGGGGSSGGGAPLNIPGFSVNANALSRTVVMYAPGDESLADAAIAAGWGSESTRCAFVQDADHYRPFGGSMHDPDEGVIVLLLSEVDMPVTFESVSLYSEETPPGLYRFSMAEGFIPFVYFDTK